MDSLDKTERKVLIQEQLYDSLGRNAFNTVSVAKGKDASSKDALVFEGSFVQDRTPSQDGGFWQGGPMEGQIQSWLDPLAFTFEDRPYAYSGSYYVSDPTSSVKQSSSPGEEFNKDSDYTPYYYAGEVPPSQEDLAKIILSQLGLTLKEAQTSYQTSSSRSPLGNETFLTQVTTTEISGAPVSSFSVNKDGSYLLSSSTYQVGAVLQSDPTKKFVGATGVPIIQQTQSHLPNTYNTNPLVPSEEKSNFQIKQQKDFLGRTVYFTSCDIGDIKGYYDKGGLLRFVQGADAAQAGVALYYTYDQLNRLLEVQRIDLPNWNIETLESYLNGAPASSNPRTIQRYTYDMLPGATEVTNTQGKLVRTESWDVGLTDGSDLDPNTDSLITKDYCYDARGNVTKIETKAKAEETTVEMTYAYNNLNQLTQVTYPLKNQGEEVQLVYTYNLQGSLEKVGRIKDGTLIDNYYASYTYNANGTLATESLNQDKLLRFYFYNVLNQLEEIRDKKGDTEIYLQEIDYEDEDGNYLDGNIQSAHYEITQAIGDKVIYDYDYTYDAFGRLTKAESADLARAPTWKIESEDRGYDSDGNLYKVVKTKEGQDEAISYAYISGTNKLDTRSDQEGSYVYTPTGRVKQTPNRTSFTYSMMSRPLTVGDMKLSYNLSGERVKKVSSQMTVKYLKQGLRTLQEEVTYGSNTYQLTYIYGVTGLSSIEIEGVQNKDYDGTYFVIKDNQGSIRMICDAATNNVKAHFTYDAFGNIVEASSSDGAGQGTDGAFAGLIRYLYTGQEWDPEVSLYNYHARQYDPTLGRYLTPDPKLQTPSPYLYVANNPVNMVDPSGGMFKTFISCLNGQSQNLGPADIRRGTGESINSNQIIDYEFAPGSLNSLTRLEPTGDRIGGGLTGILSLNTNRLYLAPEAPRPSPVNPPVPLADPPTGSAHEVMAQTMQDQGQRQRYIDAGYIPADFNDAGFTLSEAQPRRNIGGADAVQEVFNYENLRGFSISKLESELNPRGRDYVVRFASNSLNIGRGDTNQSRLMSQEQRLGIFKALDNGGVTNVTYENENMIQAMGVTDQEFNTVADIRAETFVNEPYQVAAVPLDA